MYSAGHRSRHMVVPPKHRACQARAVFFAPSGYLLELPGTSDCRAASTVSAPLGDPAQELTPIDLSLPNWLAASRGARHSSSETAVSSTKRKRKASVEASQVLRRNDVPLATHSTATNCNHGTDPFATQLAFPWTLLSYPERVRAPIAVGPARFLPATPLALPSSQRTRRSSRSQAALPLLRPQQTPVGALEISLPVDG
jgi:hypothetical protein